MKDRNEQLLQYLEGTLSAQETERVRGLLENDAEMRAALTRLQSLQGLLNTSRADSFGPYFADRVMKQLQPQAIEQTSESFYESLSWIFKRTAFACMIGVLALGTINVLDYQSLGLAASVVEAIFGLPSASISDALTYGAV